MKIYNLRNETDPKIVRAARIREFPGNRGMIRRERILRRQQDIALKRARRAAKSAVFALAA